ncbi:hypothetical protein AMECASPLE_018529, partial [Ameca splendens]
IRQPSVLQDGLKPHTSGDQRRKFNLEDSPLLPAPSNYSTTFSAPTNQLVRFPQSQSSLKASH